MKPVENGKDPNALFHKVYAYGIASTEFYPKKIESLVPGWEANANILKGAVGDDILSFIPEVRVGNFVKKPYPAELFSRRATTN